MVKGSMTEADLRDLLANNIAILEPGLTLLKKEQYIPHPLGTKSFTDLYAKDVSGQHVLIELKKNDASAREALHEIHKYVEGVKQHLGARDDEIRIIVASTQWRELLVPFSRLAADTKLAVSGVILHFDDLTGAVTASPAQLLPVSHGRFIAPWHDVNWYFNAESLNKGIASIESCCKVKGIEDYVIVVLRPPGPVTSERQATMRSVILSMSEDQASGRTTPALPSYEYIGYFAMQTLTAEQCLHILDQDEAQFEDERESLKDMDADEALQTLHELVTCLEPRPGNDFYEIGNPAKFTKFLDTLNFQVQVIRRYGVFARNQLLEDEAIVAELRGESGSTGQRLKRTVKVSNRAHNGVSALRYCQLSRPEQALETSTFQSS
jgi:hypothetical protein